MVLEHMPYQRVDLCGIAPDAEVDIADVEGA